MKRKRIYILALACMLLIASCAIGQDDTKLTLEKVIELADTKGKDLTWSDFEQYDSIDVSSGLYSLVYDINADYYLMVGGVPDEKPSYIRLVSAEDEDKYIDIRTENMEEFLAR